MANDKLVGTVSWALPFGDGCARPDFSGVYTQISQYVEWIETGNGASSSLTNSISMLLILFVALWHCL